MIPQAQIQQARQVDLLHLIGQDTPLVRIAATRGGEWAGPCPFCGGEDRFHVVPATGRWFCRQCTPHGGDAIDYVRRRDHVSFHEAVDRLLSSNTSARIQLRSAPVCTTHTPAWREARWQDAARIEVAQASHRLNHDMAAEQGRAYLRDRGLLPATWQAWNLGYAWVWHSRLRTLAPAITLPWQAGGHIQAVQYRFIVPGLAKQDRFSQRKGGERLLFGQDMRKGRDTLILVEGEINAVSLWQTCHASADVLSCGSQEMNGKALRLAQAVAEEYQRVFVWLDELPRATAAVQAIAPGNGYALWSEGGLDANDRLQNGTLVEWLEDHRVILP